MFEDLPISSTPIKYFSSASTFVISLYQNLLGREADSPGVEYWTEQLNNKVTYLEVIQSFINGAEFKSNIDSNADFITTLYHTILDRAPDAEGFAYWSDELEHSDAATITKAFIESTEFQKLSVSSARTATDAPILLACEGGGLRAMTVDEGLVAGLIQHFNTTRGTSISIADCFLNLSALSGNSGSSWFLASLAYSENFANDLQSVDNLFNSSKSGYMDLMGIAYDTYMSKKSSDSSAADIKDFLDLVKKIPDLNWEEFLTETVFAPYNTADLLKSLKFTDSSSARTDALSSQPIIMEMSVSSNGAGIGPYGSFYENIAKVTNAGTDTDGNIYSFIPTAITSLIDPSEKPAPILPTISNNSLDVVYSVATPFFMPSPAAPSSVTLPNINYDGLSIFAAASASSSATAFLESKNASNLGPGLLKQFQEMATPVKAVVTNDATSIVDYPNLPNLNYPAVGATSPSDLKLNPTLRLGDGHFADGTSVTAGLSYFNANNNYSSFEVTVFANMPYKNSSSFNEIDPSIKSILGIGQNPGLLEELGLINSSFGSRIPILHQNPGLQEELGLINLHKNSRLTHPSNQIFDLVDKPADPSKWSPTATWSFEDQNNNLAIKYYEIKVITSPGNPYMAEGVSGVMNLWEVVTDTPMIPSTGANDWNVYSNLYHGIIDGLQTPSNGLTGADYLAQSLGLS